MSDQKEENHETDKARSSKKKVTESEASDENDSTKQFDAKKTHQDENVSSKSCEIELEEGVSLNLSFSQKQKRQSKIPNDPEKPVNHSDENSLSDSSKNRSDQFIGIQKTEKLKRRGHERSQTTSSTEPKQESHSTDFKIFFFLIVLFLISPPIFLIINENLFNNEMGFILFSLIFMTCLLSIIYYGYKIDT